MKNTDRLLKLLLAGVTAVSLAACGGGTQSSTAPVSSAEESEEPEETEEIEEIDPTGTYILVTSKNGEESLNRSLTSFAYILGGATYLDIKPDGSATMEMNGETQNLDWSGTTLIMDGEEAEYTLDGDILTIRNGATVMEFERYTTDFVFEMNWADIKPHTEQVFTGTDHTVSDLGLTITLPESYKEVPLTEEDYAENTVLWCYDTDADAQAVVYTRVNYARNMEEHIEAITADGSWKVIDDNFMINGRHWALTCNADETIIGFEYVENGTYIEVVMAPFKDVEGYNTIDAIVFSSLRFN